MPRAKGKKKSDAPTRPKTATEVTNPNRAGLPAPDSIVDIRQIERGGKVYRIIKTNERDEYDEPEGKARKK